MTITISIIRYLAIADCHCCPEQNHEYSHEKDRSLVDPIQRFLISSYQSSNGKEWKERESRFKTEREIIQFQHAITKHC